MIKGIGCDIVKHEITKDLCWESNPTVLKRILTISEIDIFSVSKKEEFISGRFAAKEAVLKCLGTGMTDGLSMTDIQILNNETGAPVVQVFGGVKEAADKIGVRSWHISLTHSTDYSVAFVLAEG